jgi:O-antigen/teichoic acid export membrane protein
MLPGAIATVLFPKVSSMEDEDANIITPRMTRHGILLITITSILLALFARLLITFFFGDQFLPSVTPFLILLPGTIALGGTKILASDLAGRGKPQIGTYAVSITLVFNLILNLLFIPRWGISGAAFASSISYILCSIIVVIAFTKISNISLFDILIIRKKDFLDYKKFLLIFK